jgi:hypothetical protein
MNKQQVNVRLDQQTYAALQKLANSQGRSVGNMVSWILRAEIARLATNPENKNEQAKAK